MNKKRITKSNGYMLIEIILASAIAFVIAFFIIDLTIQLKNKNDDLLVETIVTTDQNMIANRLMKYISDSGYKFECSDFEVSGNDVIYNKINVKDTVNKNAEVLRKKCSNSNGVINVRIPLTVKQIPNKNFDVKINYKYSIPKINFKFSVIDAKTGRYPSGLDYKLYINSDGGWVEYNSGVTTNRDFNVVLDRYKKYKIEVSGDHYFPTSYEFDSNDGSPTHIKVFVISDGGDEITVVLTWDDSVPDLDSHTKVYDANNRQLAHVYFVHKISYIGGEKVVNLDLDDITFFGPETTTIKKTNYYFLFYVHNYSREANNIRGDMTKSKCNVKVFDRGDMLADIDIPAVGGDPFYWKVFSYDGINDKFTFYTERVFSNTQP